MCEPHLQRILPGKNRQKRVAALTLLGRFCALIALSYSVLPGAPDA
jgi:hypothetical protein